MELTNLTHSWIGFGGTSSPSCGFAFVSLQDCLLCPDFPLQDTSPLVVLCSDPLGNSRMALPQILCHQSILT